VDEEKRVVDAQKLDRLLDVARNEFPGNEPLLALLAELFSMTDEERRWYFESRRILVGGAK